LDNLYRDWENLWRR